MHLFSLVKTDSAIEIALLMNQITVNVNCNQISKFQFTITNKENQYLMNTELVLCVNVVKRIWSLSDLTDSYSIALDRRTYIGGQVNFVIVEFNCM